MGTSVVIQIPIDLEAKSKKAELLLFDFKDFVAPTGLLTTLMINVVC
jgi:hypothetical protein